MIACASNAPTVATDSSVGDATDSQGAGEVTSVSEDGGNRDTSGGPASAEETSSGGADTSASSTDGGCEVGPVLEQQHSCSTFGESCGSGYKCVPYVHPSAGLVNGCFPVACATVASGEPCEVDAGLNAGVDNCAADAWCWTAAVGGTDTCIPSCVGSSQDPKCDDPHMSCVQLDYGEVNLCLPTCDPLAQNCEVGSGCYPAPGGASFNCFPPGDALLAEPCGALNGCAPGLVCSDAAALANCQDPYACCAQLCDASDPEADARCMTVDREHVCESYFGQQGVGVCLVPP